MEYLTIGSVVRVKGLTEKRMISGYLRVDPAGRVWDYAAVPYPLGVGDMPVAMFNAGSIEEVLFTGYCDKDYALLQQVLASAKDEAARRIAAGELKPAEKSGENKLD